jgi:hypothetical protein
MDQMHLLRFAAGQVLTLKWMKGAGCSMVYPHPFSKSWE